MLCTNRRAACICGLGRSAALQILAIATAIAAVCALQPIPIRSAGFPLDVCRASLTHPTALFWQQCVVHCGPSKTALKLQLFTTRGPQNVFTISSWVCGRGFGRSASLQILAIAKLLLWFAPRNPSRTASPTPSFETMNTFSVFWG